MLPVFGTIVEFDTPIHDLDVAHGEARWRAGRPGKRLVEQVGNVVALVGVAHQVQRGAGDPQRADHRRPAQYGSQFTVDVELAKGKQRWTFAALRDRNVAERRGDRIRVDLHLPDGDLAGKRVRQRMLERRLGYQRQYQETDRAERDEDCGKPG